ILRFGLRQLDGRFFQGYFPGLRFVARDRLVQQRCKRPRSRRGVNLLDLSPGVLLALALKCVSPRKSIDGVLLLAGPGVCKTKVHKALFVFRELPRLTESRDRLFGHSSFELNSPFERERRSQLALPVLLLILSLLCT